MDRALKPDDGQAMSVLYRAYRDRRDCPDEQTFSAAMKSFELAYMVCGAEVMGVALRKQGCIHIGVLPQWRSRWATRGFIRTLLDWAAQTGSVWTRVMPGNQISERLVQGVGFVLSKDRYELQP